MKTRNLLLVGILAVVMAACGGSKNVNTKYVGTSPFGDVHPAPCQVFDTKDTYAATGIAKGSSNQKGELHISAIENAKAQIRAKFRSAYKGMVSEYVLVEGNNNGDDISKKLERAGDQIVDIVLNDAMETCAVYSNVDERGMVECYVAIQISKDDLSEGVAKKIGNMLTQEEKDRIRFNEEEYRTKMDEKLNNQPANK